nr:uncharacterized protein LOC108344424 [Ipomoea batatas]
MAGDSFLSKPPVFTGENYHAWFVKMETYLEAHGLWEMLEIDEVPALPEDPTIAQMRETKRMQVLNLKREFEMQKMKETESLKDYSKRLKKVVNKIRLLGEELPDDRVVEKILAFFMHLKLKNKEGPTGMKVTLREHSKQMRWNWDKNEPENIKEESGELLEDKRIDDIHAGTSGNSDDEDGTGSLGGGTTGEEDIEAQIEQQPSSFTLASGFTLLLPSSSGFTLFRSFFIPLPLYSSSCVEQYSEQRSEPSEERAIIYVVDSSDTEKLVIAKEEFHAILEEEELKGVDVLIFANTSEEAATTVCEYLRPA